MLKKILFIIFLIFLSYQFLNSCTKPFETDSSQEANKTQLVYGATNKNSSINEFALSKNKEKFAILRNSRYLNLYNAEHNLSYTDTLIKISVLNVNDEHYQTQLSPRGNKVCYTFNTKVYIVEIQSGKIDSIPLPDNRKFESFNWANSENGILYVMQNSSGDSSWIYLIDLYNKNTSLIYHGDLLINRATMDPDSNILYFSAVRNFSYNSNIYIKNLNQNILDSIVLNEPYIHTLSISNNGEQICYIADNQGYKLKIYKLASNSVIKSINVGSVKYLCWSPDDSKILMPRSQFYYILTLSNNDLSYYRINSGSINNGNAVWNELGQKILFFIEESSQAIDIINTKNAIIQYSFNLQDGYQNIFWDFDDKSIYYSNSNYLFQLDIQTGKQDTLPLQLSHFGIGKCSYDGQWLAIKYGPGSGGAGIVFFNKQSNKYYDIEFEEYGDFYDFDWIKNSYKLCMSFYNKYGIKIFKWDKPDLTLERLIESGIYDKMKWAPATSEILDTFGDYFAYNGNGGFGIFMINSGNQLYIGRNLGIKYFDWSADGRSLFFLKNSIVYKEQIFYEK